MHGAKRKRSNVWAIVLCAIGFFTASVAQAQDTPVGPIHMLLGFADGGSYAIAKLLTDNIAKAMGQPVVIEPKPGATGQIAAEALKNAPADGSTLYLAPIAVAVLAPLVFHNLRFDPVKDFSPVAQVITFRYALAVSPHHPAKTIPEFVAWAKAHPKQASYGTPGAGSVPHFIGTMMNQVTGMELLQVPYKGGGPMQADLMSDQIPCGIDGMGNLIESHRAGRLRILAVSGAERSPLAPSIPTFREQGLTTSDVVGWIGVFAPARTPKATVDRLSVAINEVLRTPSIREKYFALGFEPMGTTPEEFASIIAADSARWAPIIKASGFKAD